MKKRWIVAFTVVWPVLHLVVFLFRFREPPPMLGLLYFVPTGMLGALAMHVLLLRSRSPAQTAATVMGALLLAPLALAGNLLGGLFGLIGVTV